MERLPGSPWASGSRSSARLSRIVVAGEAGSPNQIALAGYLPNGTLDSSIGGGTGKVTQAVGVSGGGAGAVAIQRDGKIVVAGADFPATGTEMFVARFNENGTLDAGFNGGIVANANAGRDASPRLIQPGDKIGSLIGVARFHGGTTGADGALDTSFGTNGAPGQRVGRRAHVVERNRRPGQEEAQRHSR